MLKFSRYSYFISGVVKIKVSKHCEVTLATSTLNEFTLENVTAALSVAGFDASHCRGRVLSCLAIEGHLSHYLLGEERITH
jgi:hypothetical protein